MGLYIVLQEWMEGLEEDVFVPVFVFDQSSNYK